MTWDTETIGQEQGLGDAAEVLSSSLPWDVDNYSVCDNVDLKIIMEEFSSYHQVTDYDDLF